MRLLKAYRSVLSDRKCACTVAILGCQYVLSQYVYLNCTSIMNKDVIEATKTVAYALVTVYHR